MDPLIALPVTSISALVLGVLLLLLTNKVIRIRRRDGVVLGDNSDRVLAKAIRGQANAAEQIPMALLLMGLCELGGAPAGALWGLALTLILGRVAHGIYFAINGTHWRLRFYGMLLTLIAQAGLLFLLALSILL